MFLVRVVVVPMAKIDDMGVATRAVVMETTGTVLVVDAVDDAGITLAVVAQRCRSGKKLTKHV